MAGNLSKVWASQKWTVNAASQTISAGRGEEDGALPRLDAQGNEAARRLTHRGPVRGPRRRPPLAAGLAPHGRVPSLGANRVLEQLQDRFGHRGLALLPGKAEH